MEEPWRERRLHVLGIAGAGMSGYALAAQALGARVTGSDRAQSPYLGPVRAAGIEVSIGRGGDELPADEGLELVISTAIPDDDAQLMAARERGLVVLRRAQLLAQLTALRRTIAVAGAHGKTTTSSMVVHVLLRCGLDPGYLVGGVLATTQTNAAWGTGEWLVVEADESDRSFLQLDVEIAVVTNVETDHEGDLSVLRADFAAFLAGAPQAVVWDRPELLALRAPGAAVAAYEPMDVVLHDGGSTFSWRDERVRLGVPGVHNARNAAAALEAAALAGAGPAAAAAALADFAGAGRRFERLGRTASGALVIDDYAHHPTEVAATIAAARTLEGAGRVVAIFQPHLYSRTAAYAPAFGAALAGADVIALLDVYPARERAEEFPGVTGRLLAQHAAQRASGRPVYWLPSFSDVETVLAPALGHDDIVLVMGAGDVDALGRSLVAS